jgi:2-iminobutanoate/2-iminopropanoate deaminase
MNKTNLLFLSAFMLLVVMGVLLYLMFHFQGNLSSETPKISSDTLSLAQTNQTTAMHTIINSKRAPEPIGPYNQAVRAGNTLYVSGQIAINRETGEMVTADIASETHQVMRNLEFILHEAGMGFRNVVKCTIFLRDMNDFTTVNNIYGQYFTSHFPARETVQVARLPKDVGVEISCIAVAQ